MMIAAAMRDPALAWRARVMAEYQSIRIVQTLTPETLDGAAEAIVADPFATDSKAVRLTAGAARLSFSLKLEEGVYAIWVYARVPGSEVDGPWPPLSIEMLVTKPSGEQVRSRQRIGYQPMYQVVTRLFFIAPEKGTCRVALSLGKRSAAPLLIDLLEIRDELDGCVFKRAKRESTLPRHEKEQVLRRPLPAKPKPVVPILGPKASVDDLAQFLGNVRESLPPMNALLGGCDRPTPELKELAKTLAKGTFRPSSIFEPWALTDFESGARYDAASYAAGEPYEGGLPDDGGGFYAPEGTHGVTGRAKTIAALAPFFGGRLRAVVEEADRRSAAYVRSGDPILAREAALMLTALAERHPTFFLGVQDMFRTFGPSYYERFGQCTGNPLRPLMLATIYDRVFDVVAEDSVLARAVKGFVPRVRSTRGLRAFLDRNILQYSLVLSFRFTHLSQQFGWERRAARLLRIFGPNKISQTYMDRVFTQCFADLTGDGSYRDYLINGTTRDGANYIGSSTYAQGVPAQIAGIAMDLKDFVQRGGRVPRFAYDSKVNPRLGEIGRFYLDFRSAGGFHSLYGDGGQHSDYRYDKLPRPKLGPAYRWFFRQTGDPRYAWLARRLGRGPGVTDEEWQQLEAAAEGQRNPVRQAGSVVMPGFGYMALEIGSELDDIRQKGAACLRFGTGRGHAHGDLLDLSLHAYNGRITTDGGRTGWPWLRLTAQHNVVEVDRASFQATGVNSGPYGYPLMMCDRSGARFMSAGGWCSTHPNLTDFRRDVALIDLGTHSVNNQPLRHYYVFDLQRVGGGKVHTYCQHAMWCDTLEHNTPSAPATDAPESLVHRASSPRKGVTADPFVSTWRGYPRGRFKGLGLRHHLFGWGDLPFYTANCYGDRVPFLWVERESQDQMHAVYPAVFEPFYAEPNLTSVKLLAVTGAGEGSHGACAAEVVSRWGRRDVVIINESGRSVSVEGGVETDGHYAFLAEDGGGLAQAALVGGTFLRRGSLKVQTDKAAYEGTVTGFDPWTLELATDPPLPADPRLNGALVSFGYQRRRAGETLVVKDGKVYLERWPLLFRSPLARVDEAGSAVYPEIALPLTAADPQSYVGCSATNAAHDRFWHVERTEVAEMWMPIFTPIAEEDIADTNGDGRRTVRLTGFAVPWLTRDPVILYYGPFFKDIRMKQFSREPFREPVELEVTRVDRARRTLHFRPPEHDYDLVWNGWVYDGTIITNEAGTRQWRGNVPAREFRLILSGKAKPRDELFTDERLPWGEEPDGQRRIFLYDFGPGDTYRLETHVSFRRGDDGKFVCEANAALKESTITAQ